MQRKEFTVEELARHPEIHTVWISEQDRIASFHAVEGYMVQTFTNHDFFMSYIHSLQEQSFRFQ